MQTVIGICLIIQISEKIFNILFKIERFMINRTAFFNRDQKIIPKNELRIIISKYKISDMYLTILLKGHKGPNKWSKI